VAIRPPGTDPDAPRAGDSRPRSQGGLAAGPGGPHVLPAEGLLSVFLVTLAGGEVGADAERGQRDTDSGGDSELAREAPANEPDD
jgi:hypothetical protein